MATGKRIFAITENLDAALAERAASRAAAAPAEGASQLPKTSPGRLMHANSELLELEAELRDVKKRLELWDGSMPTTRLDPAAIVKSRLANRNEAAYTAPEFARFKESIAMAGGNVQPILVCGKPDGDGHQLVFGHRRHRACLELGLSVLAVVWDKTPTDEELFLAMDRENRERADLSAYEQGRFYQAALDKGTGFYPSERALAQALGVSRTWIQKTLRVANLPPAIVEAFQSPLEIKPAQAEAISLALDENSKAVLKRAERVRQMVPRPGAARVVSLLLGLQTEAKGPTKLKVDGRGIGAWHRDSRGRTVLTFDSGVADDELMQKLQMAIQSLMAEK